MSAGIPAAFINDKFDDISSVFVSPFVASAVISAFYVTDHAVEHKPIFFYKIYIISHFPISCCTGYHIPSVNAPKSLIIEILSRLLT